MWAISTLTWHMQMIWQVALRCWLLAEVNLGQGTLFQWLPDMHMVTTLTSTAMRWRCQALLPNAGADYLRPASCWDPGT